MSAATGRALAAVMGRVAVTAAEVGPRFPLYADPADGRWTTTGRGSWTGGFWAGLLWLRARYTGAESDRRAAAACTARLEAWAGADTATRGLIFWYGTAAAGDDAEAAALRARAARACLSACDPELGILPWGDALGGPRLLARVDAVPGTVPLLAGAGPDGAAAAAAHLHRHLDLCLGRPGTGTPWFRPALGFEPATGRWQPCADPPPGWSRGQAWLLLAVADAMLRPAAGADGPARLAEAATLLLTRGEVLAGPPVPPADTARPDGPADTSAAAITAVALLKLARTQGPRAEQYALRAEEILDRLTRSHLTGDDGARPPGMLLDGCYDAAKGLAVRHELVWGDFFLALALSALHGVTDITRV
ncbi:sugar ABC transporter permease [Streptomyces sp. fd1-xmd]|uniref:sugar ABC transporter permease n=1 Tax=Streptomyces sp. fd1-xmd TaxID=1812480 RepID=UPI001CED146B|nr:sugar ABC transporter permease [Streptomyces sp. fd1-xmd]